MKKLFLILLMFSVLSVSANAGYKLWTNGYGDGLWNNGDNWIDIDTYASGVPGPTDIATFGNVWQEAVINTSIDANSMNMGCDNGYPSSVRIANGGSAHFKGAPSVVISYDPNCYGTLTVEQGGTMTVDWQLTIGQWGSGTLTINGGQVTCAILFLNAGIDGSGAGVYTGKVRSQINLNAGTLKVTDGIFHGSRVPFGLNIDLKKGTLLVSAANGVFNVAAANAWANAGMITAWGQGGSAVKAESVVIGGINYTKVTAACQISTGDGNLNSDCVVNFGDFAVFASNWLKTGN